MRGTLTPKLKCQIVYKTQKEECKEESIYAGMNDVKEKLSDILKAQRITKRRKTREKGGEEILMKKKKS